MKLKKKITKQIGFAIVSAFLVAGWFFLWGGMDAAQADELITCRYLSSKGLDISLELEVGFPAPSMIILIQKVPAATAIIKASPEFKKYDAIKGEAKWLFSGVKPGRIKMAMTLSKPIKSNEVMGEIRYKNPATGQMVTMTVAP